MSLQSLLVVSASHLRLVFLGTTPLYVTEDAVHGHSGPQSSGDTFLRYRVHGTITDIIEFFLFLDRFLLYIINTVYYLVKVHTDCI